MARSTDSVRGGALAASLLTCVCRGRPSGRLLPERDAAGLLAHVGGADLGARHDVDDVHLAGLRAHALAGHKGIARVGGHGDAVREAVGGGHDADTLAGCQIKDLDGVALLERGHEVLVVGRGGEIVHAAARLEAPLQRPGLAIDLENLVGLVARHVNAIALR